MFRRENFPISSRSRLGLQFIVLALLVLVALSVRLHVISQLQGVSGGDPYNYLAITKRLIDFENPFLGDKRLPGYPAVLIPAYLTQIDDIWFMRFTSAMSAGGILILLYLLARSLKLPWSVQIMAPALLAFQKDFFQTSVRPEPYTFYALLLLAALVLFLNLHKTWTQYALGIVLGYAAMTRQEGFVLAALIGFGSLFLWKMLWWKGYLRIFLPALVLVLPFFAHNYTAYGNPLFTPYFEGDRNQIVDSWEAFKDNAGATWGVLGALWRPAWEQQIRIPLTDSFFLGGSLAAIVWWLVRTRRSITSPIGRIVVVIGSAMLLLFTIHGFLQPITFGDTVMAISAGILAVSIIPFLGLTKWRGALVAVVLISQIMIALWIHPFPKHYQQSYPLLMLLFATALIMPLRQKSDDKEEKISSFTLSAQGIYHLAVLTPFFIITALLFHDDRLGPFVDRGNQETAQDYALYQAIQVARELPGSHAFDHAYEPARMYFEGNGNYFTDKNDDYSVEYQERWIKKNNIHTVVVTSVDPVITPDPSWKEAAHFKVEGKKGKKHESWVYQIN